MLNSSNNSQFNNSVCFFVGLFQRYNCEPYLVTFRNIVFILPKVVMETQLLDVFSLLVTRFCSVKANGVAVTWSSK